MDRCAIGISVHTGWGVCVAVAGSLKAPRVLAREELRYADDLHRFVFHRAAEMDLADARRFVARTFEEVAEAAVSAFARFAAPLEAAEICAIAASDKPPLPLEQIVAAHARIHAAEGTFHRDVLRRAAEAHGLRVRIVPPRSLELDAAEPQLAAIGRSAGRPWSKDHRVAALAAWTALAARA
jgi:hypothetical protein